MIVGGIQWTTLLDYPGRVAATVFTAGCNLRCPFCHNPELVLPDRVSEIGAILGAAFFEKLEQRKGFLDALVFSGGEPTLQPDLLEILERAKTMGFLIKLDTNGTSPDAVEQALDRGLLDFIAMDIKAPATQYEMQAGVPVDMLAIRRSISIIMASDLQHEFRATVAPGLGPADLRDIAAWIKGARAYWLQEFQASPGKRLVDDRCKARSALSASELHAVWQQLRDQFQTGGVRS